MDINNFSSQRQDQDQQDLNASASGTNKRGRKPGRASKNGSGELGGAKGDMRARLERSRQSARECRARKKLRYQYLEELVTHRERAVVTLRKELEQYRQWCHDMDEGQVPEGVRKLLEEIRKDRELNNQLNQINAQNPALMDTDVAGSL